MTHTVAIETGIVDAYGVLPEIPGTIEIVAELYMEERKYGGNAMGFLTETYPAIDAVTFEVVLGVGSPEASEAFSKHLSVLYGADRKFQARVHALVMEDVERWNA